MARTRDLPALAMVAVLIAAGLGALQVGFRDAPSSALASDFESIFAGGLEIAPLILIALFALGAASWVSNLA